MIQNVKPFEINTEEPSEMEIQTINRFMKEYNLETGRLIFLNESESSHPDFLMLAESAGLEMDDIHNHMGWIEIPETICIFPDLEIMFGNVKASIYGITRFDKDHPWEVQFLYGGKCGSFHLNYLLNDPIHISSWPEKWINELKEEIKTNDKNKVLAVLAKG